MEKGRWRNEGTAQALTIFIHHQFGDIADLYLRLLGGNAVGHHGQAEGTGDGDSLGASVQGLGDSARTNAFAGGIVKPHAATARAAAGGLTAVSGHLLQIFRQQRARRLSDAVHAREVAGVVVRNLFVHHGSGLEFPGRHQLAEELRVMRYFVVAIKLRVILTE